MVSFKSIVIFAVLLFAVVNGEDTHKREKKTILGLGYGVYGGYDGYGSLGVGYRHVGGVGYDGFVHGHDHGFTHGHGYGIGYGGHGYGGIGYGHGHGYGGFGGHHGHGFW